MVVILDEIRWVINFFLDKAPKPVKFILFLLLLLVLGNMISWVLHFAGIHCDSYKQVHKTEALDVITNVKIFWLVTSDALTGQTESISDVHPWSGDTGILKLTGDCYWILKNVSGRLEKCTNISDPNCKFYYRNGEDYNCTTTDAGWIYAPETVLNWEYAGVVCASDATRLEGQSWLQRNVFSEPLCDIPEHYAWDFDNGNYKCIDSAYCGANATIEPQTRLDNELRLAGSKYLYSNKNTNSIDNAILITCSDTYNPRLTFYGIDLFNYKYWVLIMVIYVMFIFLTHIKRH